MNKIIKISLIGIFTISLVTGCGCTAKNNKTEVEEPNIEEKEPVVEDKTYEGLEFFNVGYENGIIKTIVINNTGRTLGVSTFSIKIMDNEGKVISELKGDTKEKIPTGTTKTIETKVGENLANATSVEYGIIEEK